MNMSLDFSYAKVKDWKEASTDPANSENWHPVGNALVWASIPCGFDQITEANVDEIWTRVNVYQHTVGALLHRPDGSDVWLARTDVARYVGLSTNASRKTSAEFWKLIVSRAALDAAPGAFVEVAKLAMALVNDQERKA